MLIIAANKKCMRNNYRWVVSNWINRQMVSGAQQVAFEKALSGNKHLTVLLDFTIPLLSVRGLWFWKARFRKTIFDKKNQHHNFLAWSHLAAPRLPESRGGWDKGKPRTSLVPIQFYVNTRHPINIPEDLCFHFIFYLRYEFSWDLPSYKQRLPVQFSLSISDKDYPGSSTSNVDLVNPSEVWGIMTLLSSFHCHILRWAGEVLGDTILRTPMTLGR